MPKQPVRVIPNPRTGAYDICRVIHKYGAPMSISLCNTFHEYGSDGRIYHKMVENKYLCEVDGKYWLTEHIEQFFDEEFQDKEKLDIVQPMYRPPFKERRVEPRDPRLRQISFVTGGTIIEPLVRGYSK